MNLRINTFSTLMLLHNICKRDYDIWTAGDFKDGKVPDELFNSSITVSEDGNRLIIVEPFGNHNKTGCVKVYQKEENNWVQIGNPILGEALDRFSSKAIASSSDGRIIAIGSWGYNNNIGRVVVYSDNNKQWIQVGEMLTGKNNFEFFGLRVALSADGNTLAVASIEYALSKNKVRVFQNMDNSWMSKGGCILADDSGNNLISFALSTDGERIVIGSSGNNNYRGSVKAYEFTQSQWKKLGQTNYGTASSDQFGTSVALSEDGHIMAIGSLISGTNTVKGKVYQDLGNEWIAVGEEVSDMAPITIIGYDISLSADGLVLVLSANLIDSSVGFVKAYEFIEGKWTFIEPEVIDDAVSSCFGFGLLLSEDGKTFGVEAPGQGEHFNDIHLN